MRFLKHFKLEMVLVALFGFAPACGDDDELDPEETEENTLY